MGWNVLLTITVDVVADLDECRLMPDACQHGRCINTLGSYRCLCDPGYQVDLAQRESQCIDVDECETVSPSPCEFNCRNTPGTFVCTCPIGYTLARDQRTCLDVDECDSEQSGLHACSQKCLNTRGSYECVCHDGYQRQDNQCVGRYISLSLALCLFVSPVEWFVVIPKNWIYRTRWQ